MANPSFLFSINICKDQNCNEKSKIFLKNENIYLDYDSSIEGIALTAKMTYPDNSIKEITVPGSMKASQIGTYELEVNASKAGYKTISAREQFAVIENNADIKTGEELESSIPETIQNDEENPSNIWKIVLIVFIVLAILIILGIIIILYIKKRDSNLNIIPN